MSKFTIFLIFILCLLRCALSERKKCFRRVHGSRTFVPQVADSDDDNIVEESGTDQQPQIPPVLPSDVGTTFRTANQEAYLWPSLTDREKFIIRDAFHQIHRRTCIRFNELDYKPWYHHERWSEGKPYVVIRKSKKFFGYSDNKIEGVTRRSLIYLSEKSLDPQHPGNSSRGMIMEQLLKFMGYREEYLRPDAPSYIRPIPGSARPAIPATTPKFSNEQLMWPFDPESITMPAIARDWFTLTIYCQARQNEDIGAGQRTGILTRWDAVKLNTMYCPQHVGYADPRMGPCVVARKKLCKEGESQLAVEGGCVSQAQLLLAKHVGTVQNNKQDVNKRLTDVNNQPEEQITTNNDNDDESDSGGLLVTPSSQDINNFFGGFAH